MIQHLTIAKFEIIQLFRNKDQIGKTKLHDINNIIKYSALLAKM